MRSLIRSIAAGYAATLLMEQISTWIYARHNQAVREREEQLRTEMPTSTLARKVAGAAGRQLSDKDAERAGMVLHSVFGAGGGPVSEVLIRLGMSPMGAGVSTGLGMFVFVDEGFNTIAGLTPPPGEWPTATHARALVNHLAYGAALGLLLDRAKR